MAKNSDWLPGRMPDQVVMFTNVKAKIAGHQTALGLSGAQVGEIEGLCDEFVAVYNFVEQSKQTMRALTEWRDAIFDEGPVGDPVPAAPVFEVWVNPAGYVLGVIPRFRAIVENLKTLEGYTVAIGEDLMIAGVDSIPTPLGEVTPDLKITSGSDYSVKIAGSMQQMDSIKIEYKRKGSDVWELVGFFTRLPGELTITPATPGAAEAGEIRGRFMKNNVAVGNYSPAYAVTIS